MLKSLVQISLNLVVFNLLSIIYLLSKITSIRPYKFANELDWWLGSELSSQIGSLISWPDSLQKEFVDQRKYITPWKAKLTRKSVNWNYFDLQWPACKIRHRQIFEQFWSDNFGDVFSRACYFNTGDLVL